MLFMRRGWLASKSGSYRSNKCGQVWGAKWQSQVSNPGLPNSRAHRFYQETPSKSYKGDQKVGTGTGEGGLAAEKLP